MASRNRILYQSEALYVGSATGTANGHAVATQLNRVQDISHDLDINRTDIFEFGRLAPLTRQVIDAPVVSLDFSYLLADGDNERKMGFNIKKSGDAGDAPWANAISGLLDNAVDKEKDYYVVTTKEYLDVDPGGNATSTSAPLATDCTVVGFGNGAISNYVVNAAVGDLPTASISIEAYNCKFVAGQVAPSASNQWISGDAPTVNKATSKAMGDTFGLPTGSTGLLEVFSLRPGDITIAFGTGNLNPDGGSVLEADKLQIGGAILPTGDPDAVIDTGETPIHIQNFSLEVPLARTPLNQIGTSFPYDRAVDFPLDMTLNMSSFLADVSAGSLVDLMCETQEQRDATITCKFPCGRKENRGGADATDINIQYVIKNVYLQSQNFGATIGDNKTVDLSFTAQFGGVSDTSNGLFMSGIGRATSA